MLSRRRFVAVAGGSALACRGGQVEAMPRDAGAVTTMTERHEAEAGGAKQAGMTGPGEAAAGGARQAGMTGRGEVAAVPADLITRKIGRSGEVLPAIGMGTWETFDVGSGAVRDPLREVLRVFSAGGGRVIDSSPMYGAAEEVTGDLVAETAIPTFLATKVWTRGREAGERQMQASMRLLRARQIDLMQVHNLLDFDTHITTLRRWRDEGKIRYIGATHYQRSAFDALERVIREEQLDFVQLPYSIGNREAEKRLLPAAADHGVAVLVMQPFESGSLFDRVRGKAVPAWAAELGCASWAQIFLKFIVGHPAVHCPLPATRKPGHMADNMGAGRGRVPDEAERRRMIAACGL